MSTAPERSTKMKLLLSTLLLILNAAMATANNEGSTIISHENCDANSLPAEKTNISTLDNGKFYKMCPGSHQNSDGETFAPLGQPRCGDGSSYSFYLTRPEQPQKEDKILIEFSGGGACWDQATCMMQSFMLKMPAFDFILGMSCTDVGQFADASSGWDILCDRTVGETDFTEYNSIFIPYCTQDVHLGDAEAQYNGLDVQHAGAHNTFRTLQWVFDNFENPSHIVLTGCSAGATPLPVIYRMIKEHYKAKGQNVEVEVIADSPVYLTPSNFMETNFDNWNHGTVMKSIGFDYDAHKEDMHYATAVLDYVLDNSDDNDGFGMFSHNVDGISLLFYKSMGGEGDTEEWWSEMNTSWSQLKEEHDNFDVFISDASGHCSSGLYIPNQQPGFDKWVSNIIEETSIVSVQQDTVATNTSVSTSAETGFTFATTDPDKSEPLESTDVLPMSNDEFPTIENQQQNDPSTATSKTPAGNTLIATVLFFQLMFSLFG